MNNVHSFNSFINLKDSQFLIDHIEKNIDIFSTGPKKLYHIQKFGHNPIDPMSNKISEYPEVLSIVQTYFDKAIALAKTTFNDEKTLYPSSLWFARQIPGAKIILHGDDDYGTTTYFKYSCSVYLNNTKNTDPISFPALKYDYLPNAGDMVLWPSQGREYDHEVKFIGDTRYTMVMWFTDQEEFSML